MRRSHLNPWRLYTEQNYLGWDAGLESPQKIVIHGAGWSGLCLGVFLKAGGFENFILYEPHRVGGLIESRQTAYGLRETAANGYLSNSAGMDELVRILDLTPIESQASSNRKFIVRGNRLCSLPTSFKEFFTEPFLGKASKVLLLPRLLKFLFLGRPLPTWSLAEFVQKAMGGEASRTLAPAFVSGIYGGRASEICVGTAFPQIYSRFESRASRQKKKRRKGKLLSFRGGMEEMNQAMARYLDGHITDQRPPGTDVMDEKVLHVATVPALALKEVLPGALAEVASMAQENVHYAPMVSVQGFVPKKFLEGRPDGFGALVPPQEDYRMLGVLFNDLIFENRVQDKEMASLNILFGGARDPAVFELEEPELVALAEEECRRLLGLKSHFVHSDCIKTRHAIPQYTKTLGEFWDFSHRALLTHNWNATHQWVAFGNYTGQVSLKGIATGAQQLAEELIHGY